MIYNFQIYIGRIATRELIRDRLYLCIKTEQDGEIGPRHQAHLSTRPGAWQKKDTQTIKTEERAQT